jgi:hypothetical protein
MRTILVLLLFPVIMLGAEADANTGWFPDDVALANMPPATKEKDASMAMLEGMIDGSCLLEDIEFGSDQCQILYAQVACLRVSTYWPWGVMEGTNEYGLTGLDWQGHVKFMKKAVNSVLPTSRSQDSSKASDGAMGGALDSSVKYVHTVGRSLPPPIALTAIAAVLNIATYGQWCPMDSTTLSNQGIDWYSPEMDRGITGGRNTWISPYFDSPTLGALSLASITLTQSGLSSLDVFGILSNGQNGDQIGRASSGYNSMIDNLLRNMVNAAQITYAPSLYYGWKHYDVGGVTRWDNHDSDSITAQGKLSNIPKFVIGTNVQVLYPGDLNGCPEKECWKFWGDGTEGTLPRLASIFIAEQRSLPKDDKVLSLLFYPYLTCCRNCQLDTTGAQVVRQVNPIVGDGFLMELVGSPSQADTSQSQSDQEKNQQQKDQAGEALGGQRKQNAENMNQAGTTNQTAAGNSGTTATSGGANCQ